MRGVSCYEKKVFISSAGAVPDAVADANGVGERGNGGPAGLRELRERGHHLYIITNAVASVQRNRLRGSVFADLFDGTFISEEAGAAKPDRAYFDYVRRRLPCLTAENALVIGDSLSTDIQGANNAGLPCCWFNPAGKPRREDLRVDYEIRSLRELLEIA